MATSRSARLERFGTSPCVPSEDPTGLSTLVGILRKPPVHRSSDDIALLVPLLSKIEFFRSRNLAAADLRSVARCLTYVKAEPGEKIIEYGQLGRTFYIILAGTVGVLVPFKVKKQPSPDQNASGSSAAVDVSGGDDGENKKEEEQEETETIFKEVATLSAGKSFGELALITNKPRYHPHIEAVGWQQ